MVRVPCAVVFALALSGCTKPNPKSCADGICSDQQYPFCDVDGTLGGEPNECIAVSCTPGEHIACRGDEAVRCNVAGTNYEIVSCALGCEDATGCSTCETNDQCANPSPVCDPMTKECRTCRVDDECASRVCDVDAGTCLAESEVVFATPSGAAAGPCSLATPCSIERAVELAFGNPLRSTLRLLPGRYETESLLLQLDGKINVVGTGATVLRFVMDRGEADIRGVDFGDLSFNSYWRSHGLQAPNRLHVRDSTIETRQRISTFNSFTKFTRVQARWPLGGEFDITRLSHFEAYESHFTCGTGICSLNTTGDDRTIKIVNSVFQNFMVFMTSSTDVSTQSRFEFAFNTFFSPASAEPIINCVPPDERNWTALFEDNILYSGATNTVVTHPKCTFNRNVIFPQPIFTSNNKFEDPKFVDLVNSDLHLQAGSPAIDAALPSAGLDPAIDVDGTPRPQGTAKDIGAYERKP